jgi:hypothetical protein
MENSDIFGLIIFMGGFMAVSIVLCADMERRLRRIDRVIQDIENDNKYVN